MLFIKFVVQQYNLRIAQGVEGTATFTQLRFFETFMIVNRRNWNQDTD